MPILRPDTMSALSAGYEARSEERMRDLGTFLKWYARLEASFLVPLDSLGYTPAEIRSWYDAGHTVDDCFTGILDELRSSYELNRRGA